ncbi:FkbM family methyltransferase [Runella aurantiaca]|uniref:FkbM family methyltransferase n=1 Tax=Runella aurantiaca TaxID=2282308 RepID=A0A369I4D3_9BACT|nr:FkbM family methyltransferase [Runella aurantiaca]RDB03902.1 FkbM family methyltransferase [Runella aurantiaca]
MIKALKKQVWQWLNALKLGGSVQLYLESELKNNGWFRSFHTKRSVDAAGNPLPWCTYPFIAFIQPRLKNHFDVFEYGSGNSTRWYAAQVQSVQAVENDEEWVKEVGRQLPPNAEVTYRALGEKYVSAVQISGKKYQIIVVDGRKRVDCMRFSVDFLTADGVLILDNSERESYAEVKGFMRALGFRWIDFYGMAPIVSHLTCTTIFYRDTNCLDI